MGTEDTFSVKKDGDMYVLSEMLDEKSGRVRTEQQTKEGMLELYSKINTNIVRHDQGIKNNKKELELLGDVDTSQQVQDFLNMMQKAEALKQVNALKEQKQVLEEGRIKLLKRKNAVEVAIPELKR